MHSPAQVPEQYKEPYRDMISDPERLTFAGEHVHMPRWLCSEAYWVISGMLACLDEGIGNVTAALASKGCGVIA